MWAKVLEVVSESLISLNLLKPKKMLSRSQDLSVMNLVLNHTAMISKPTTTGVLKSSVIQGPVTPWSSMNFSSFWEILWNFFGSQDAGDIIQWRYHHIPLALGDTEEIQWRKESEQGIKNIFLNRRYKNFFWWSEHVFI